MSVATLSGLFQINPVRKINTRRNFVYFFERKMQSSSPDWQAMFLLVGFGIGWLVYGCLLVYHWLLLFSWWAGLVVYRVVYWPDPYQATKQEAAARRAG